MTERHSKICVSFGPRNGRRFCGFSLIELLIAMLLGMITLLVVAQAFSSFEGSKRTTTNGADAQANGTEALYFLQSDILMGGYGLVTPQGFACTSINFYNSNMTPPVQLNVPIMPIQIIDGGNGPDTINVEYSSSPTGAAPAGLKNNSADSSSLITIQAPASKTIPKTSLTSTISSSWQFREVRRLVPWCRCRRSVRSALVCKSLRVPQPRPPSARQAAPIYFPR